MRPVYAEYGIVLNLVCWKSPREQRRDHDRPGGLPAGAGQNDPPICGASVIMEYLDETRGYAMGDRRLMMPQRRDPRRGAPPRRLVPQQFMTRSSAIWSEGLQTGDPRAQGGRPIRRVLRAAA